jgi:hypothetical protein
MISLFQNVWLDFGFVFDFNLKFNFDTHPWNSTPLLTRQDKTRLYNSILTLLTNMTRYFIVKVKECIVAYD